jgi:acyl-CoA thioesterase II
MSDAWSDLLGCLELVELAPVELEPVERPSTGARAFEGGNQVLGYHRVFGGQILAQLVRAASLTCPDKQVKSLHALFPAEGRPGEPLRYEVECHRNGASFATVAIVARQSRGVVATAAVSLHAREEGRAHQTVRPVPPLLGVERRVEWPLIPWETGVGADLDSPAARPPELELWMRTDAVDTALAPALTAYATDLTLIGTAVSPLDGVSQRDAQTAFTSAVTSHTLWFHRPFRTDAWLLLRQESPVLAHGRCFGRGDVLTEGGTLVASYAQEALLRFRDAA